MVGRFYLFQLEHGVNYIFLLYRDRFLWDRLTAEQRDELLKEYMFSNQELEHRGQLFAYEDFLVNDPVVNVQMTGERLILSDKPNSGGVDQLVGIYYIHARDFNEAIHLASNMPQVHSGFIVIRPSELNY